MECVKTQSVPGFRSFWEKSKREAAQRNLTFVQVEHGGGTKRPRRRRSSTKSAVEKEDQSPKSKSPSDEGRREQVYQAQKRHRTRKAEYAKKLKNEKAQLSHLIALTNANAERLSAENDMIKALLKANGVDTSQTITPLPLDRSNSVKRKQSASSSRTSRSSEGTRPKAPEIVLDSGDPRVNDCRTLLLQDVEAGSDEEEEEEAWKASVKAIMKSM